MSTVNNRDIPSTRPTVRRPSAESKPSTIAQSDTPPIGLASSETAVVRTTPSFKSPVPVASLGKWRIDVPAPAKPAFTLTPTDDDALGPGRQRLLQRYAPSLISLTVHCLVVLCLGIITFTTPESRGALLSGVFSEDAPALAGVISTELEDPEPPSAPLSMPPGGGDGLKEALSAIDMPSAMSGGSGSGGDGDDDVLGGPFGSGASAGGQELGEVSGSKSASFFGLSSKGKRFVFVIDSSTSMWGPRWIDVRKELIRSIRRLEKDQYFFVVCFDVTSLSMFGAESIQQDFATANEENFRKLEYWLSQHTLGPGTRATTSLAEALRLKPDAVFLLTDGEFQDNVLQMLRVNNRNKAKKRKTTVNTIGFHSEMGAPVLSRIATENYGQFKYVAPPPNLPMLQAPMRFPIGGRVYPPQTMEELAPRF